jgi:hypothetical protein
LVAGTPAYLEYRLDGIPAAPPTFKTVAPLLLTSGRSPTAATPTRSLSHLVSMRGPEEDVIAVSYSPERRVMFRSIPRPSAAMIVACVALGVALSGTSYAKILALPLNSVGTPQLRANAVTSPKVKNHSLLAADFKPGEGPGLRGYEVVDGGPVIADNQIFNSLLMTCPAGKRAIGGGGGTGGGIVVGDGPYIVVSEPSVDGTSWLVQTARAQPGSSALTGRVICAKP